MIREFVKTAPHYQHLTSVLGRSQQKMAAMIILFLNFFRYRQINRYRLSELKSQKNANVGKPCIIVGNGPSSQDLKLEHVNLIRKMGGKVFTLNNFNWSPLSKLFKPDFIFLFDPDYFQDKSVKSHSIFEYISSNPEITVVFPSTLRREFNFENQITYVNDVTATGLWFGTNPEKPNTCVPAVFFHALKFAIYLGHSPIYVIGVEHSYFLHVKHNQFGSLVLSHTSLYSYPEKNTYSEVDNRMVRNMADLHYAQAILLRDLGKFAKVANVVNVAEVDHTNDAFPFACLLPRIVN